MGDVRTRRFLVPFKSKSQMRYMFAKKPKLAKEFSSKTPKGKKLPVKVAVKKKKR